MGDARTNWRRIALNETMNMKGECHKREERERERDLCFTSCNGEDSQKPTSFGLPWVQKGPPRVARKYPHHGTLPYDQDDNRQDPEMRAGGLHRTGLHG